MDTTSLPPDDQPPVAGPRRANRGLLWASALAVVVLSIATIVAFTAGSGSDDGAETLDPDATLPVDGNELSAGSDPTGQALPAVDYQTFEGDTVTLATDGRPLVINFWAGWCIPCVKEMPALERAYLANSGEVDFLGLQVSEVAASGLEMIEQTGVTYPVGRDPRGSVIQALGGRNLPRTVLVAADGTIVAVHNGELSESEMQALIDEKLGG